MLRMQFQKNLRYHHLIDTPQIGERQGKTAQWRRRHISVLPMQVALSDHRRMLKAFSRYHFDRVGSHVGRTRHRIIIGLCQRSLQGQASQFARQWHWPVQSRIEHSYLWGPYNHPIRPCRSSCWLPTSWCKLLAWRISGSFHLWAPQPLSSWPTSSVSVSASLTCTHQMTYKW